MPHEFYIALVGRFPAQHKAIGLLHARDTIRGGRRRYRDCLYSAKTQKSVGWVM